MALIKLTVGVWKTLVCLDLFVCGGCIVGQPSEHAGRGLDRASDGIERLSGMILHFYNIKLLNRSTMLRRIEAHAHVAFLLPYLLVVEHIQRSDISSLLFLSYKIFNDVNE